LEFPEGQLVLLTNLFEGQEATLLQLPARPVTAAESRLNIRRDLADAHSPALK
jgi:hypothetical protein